ncbi:CAP domain-containing protein [Mesorhizobium sp. KR2-14]|uniref:CAP domain-containing protein n=1 Tax=Mesorhizobium sp. KR2-14 TaxID=3156610 RepID=UPI0032B3B17E
MLFLAACQTARTPGEGGVASNSAYGYLAEIRKANGLGKLEADARLERAALQQASYMARAGRMAHTTGRGKDFASRMRDNGVEGAAAENVAVGRMEMGKLFDMWMNSTGHRRNMLDPRFSRFGLAYVRAGDGSDQKYWALVVGR